MKPVTLIFLIAFGVVGFVLGWQLKVRSDPDKDVSLDEQVNELPERRMEEPAPQKAPDTADLLHALPAGELYERMAVFLLGAEAGDFPAFYEEFQKRPDLSDELNKLLFITWTRVDPEAAIEASRGSDDFKYAYWAWSCHDPAAALASAQDRSEGLGDAVAGIGEFHPAWLKENWDLIPESERKKAIHGLLRWPDTETPEVSLRLFIESKIGHYSGSENPTLLALARQDPGRAYEIIKELSEGENKHNGRETLDALIASVARYDPDLLGEIVAAAKNPLDKNKVRLGQFKSLLQEEPEAAKAMLESTPQSWFKDDLGILYASHLFATDPDQGFEYAVDFFKNHDFGSASAVWFLGLQTTNNAGLRRLISNMISQDGPALLNELVPEPGPVHEYSFFQGVSNTWAAQDVGSYANWLMGHQDNPDVYRAGASKVVGILRAKGEFEAGMEWVQSVPVAEGETNEQARSLYFDWRNRDPEGAAAWRLSDKFTGDPDKFPLPETTQSK